MNENIITAVFGTGRAAKVRPRYRYDQGQVLVVKGIRDLPDFYEVHFANVGSDADATPLIGTAEGVEIPDSYFESADGIMAYIYVHNEATDATTIYTVTIPVIDRPRPAAVEPTEEEANIISQAIVALNDNVGKAETAAEEAEASAARAEAAADGVEALTDRAEAAAQAAEASATSASSSATTAQAAAQAAAGSASDAADHMGMAAEMASNATTSASRASSRADAAASYASQAQQSANSAASAKTDAQTARTQAQGYRQAAEDAATRAGSAAAEAGTAKVAAETAQSAAEAAQTAAQAAETDTQTYAGQASQSAANAAQSAASAAQMLAQVQAEGAAQIAAIDTEGQRVIDSIPKDYTGVVSDVADLKSHLIFDINIGTAYETDGLISGETGAFTANQYFKASDFIDISACAGKKINVTCSLQNSSGYYFYDSTKNRINNSGNSGTAYGENVFGTFEASVPGNAKYIRFSVYTFSGKTYADCALGYNKLDAKLDSPGTTGTNGQALLSNGDGTTRWGSINSETDKTLMEDNVPADAATVGAYILTDVNTGSPLASTFVNGDNGIVTTGSSASYFTASDKIDVSAFVGGNIVVKSGLYNAIGFAFYTSSNRFISGVSGNSYGSNGLVEVVVEIPSTAAYMRFSIMSTQGNFDDCWIKASQIAILAKEFSKLQETKDYTKRLILPPFVRMAEGIQYSFHHNNMIRGFRAVDCDFFGWQYGAHYDDFSTITPDSTKSTHNIIFTSENGLNQYVYAKFMEPDVNTLSKSMFLRAKTASAGDGKTLNGIFIGDSFTAAGKYLKSLIQRCTDNGITLNSLGTESITVSGTTINHEGRGGWKTSDYCTKETLTIGGVTKTNAFWHNGFFDFSNYMTQQGYSELDFVALFTGVNDSITDSEETILSSINTIITSIRAYSQTIPVLLWLTPTRCIAPTDGMKRRYYNQNLSLVDCDQAQKFNCIVVDNFSSTSGVTIVPVGFNVDPIYDYTLTEQSRNTENTTQKRYMCADPIHLNDNGYQHVADMIYGTLLYLASQKT